MKRLKELRQSRFLTQTELAKDIGYSQSAVSAWELGLSKPGFDALKVLADYFDVSVEYLLNMVDDFGNRPPVPPLTEEKQTILTLYANLEKPVRDAVRDCLIALNQRHSRNT